MADLDLKCGSNFPNWGFERIATKDVLDGVIFIIPEICKTCNYINSCAFGVISQLTDMSDHPLTEDDFSLFSGNDIPNIERLSISYDEIQELMGEWIVRNAGNPQKIPERVKKDISNVIGALGNNKH